MGKGKRQTRNNVAIGTSSSTSKQELEDSDFNPGDGSDMDTMESVSAPSNKTRATQKRTTTKRKFVEDDSSAPPFKRAKNKKGVLQNFVEQPMDILLEIFELCDPVDLLNLTRTAKPFRACLLDKKSKPIWKKSFKKAKPPLFECPDDLSEPAFVDLLLGKDCSFCGRHNVAVYMAWQSRCRTCYSCLTIHFTDHVADLGHGYGKENASKLLPSFVYHLGSSEKRVYSKDTDREWEAQYADLESDKGRQAWFKKKRKESDYLRKHETAFRKWKKARQAFLNKNEKSSVENRRAAVVTYIRELGWSEELDKISKSGPKPQDLPLVTKACGKVLTERARQKRERQHNLKQRMVALRDLYEDYLATLPTRFDYASAADAYHIPSFKAIVDDCSSSSFSDVEINGLKTQFPRVQQAFQAMVKEELLALTAQDNENKNPIPEAELDKPTRVLYCLTCRASLLARDVATHLCSSSYPSYYNRNREEFETLQSAFKRVGWKSGHALRHDAETPVFLRKILERAGYDPETCTIDELEKNDPVFECLKCHCEVDGRCVFGWNYLGDHFDTHKWRGVQHDPAWYRVIDESAASDLRIQMSNADAIAFAKVTNSDAASCNHCRQKNHYAALLQHARTEHLISRPKLGQDITPNPACVRRSYLRIWPPLHKEDVDELIKQAQSTEAKK